MSQLLSTLPEIAFAELSPSEVEHSIITTYERMAEKTLFPGDPVRLFLESLAYLIAVQNAAIDLAGRQNLLGYAEGPHLDHLGALMDTPRLSPAAAITSMRFSLAEPLDWSVLIPQGSRVTTGNAGLVFSTDRTAEIPAGELYADIPATCAEPGKKGNGLVPGQINKMVDPLPVKSVANTSTTILGADEEVDDPFRGRIQLAPERFSVAGPKGAYMYHTLAAHQDIAACAVWSPKPGTVDVRPVLSRGELPPEDLLATVRERLNDERIRPLTDTVIVAAPEPVEYAALGGWTLLKSNAPLAESIRARVGAAVEEYRLWQRGMPGRDINPTRLIALMERAGAKAVRLSSPQFQALEDKQIARETSINMEFLGIEDE
jgi:phage-related baseplate assembly protein